MPKEKAQVSTDNPGIMMVKTFVAMILVNGLVIYLANMFFPEQVVLGTMSISHLWAVLLSAGTLAVINTFTMPFFTIWEQQVKRVLTPMEWMGGYLVINFVGLWLITRVAEIFGLGVASWLVILVLAVVLDFLQGLVMMNLEKMRLQAK